MYKLDRLDKGIMLELDKNARASYQQIAKNIKSKKDVVAYRVNKLLSEKIIKKFVTIFALGKLQNFCYKIYFQFQGLGDEQKMLDDFNKDPHVIWIAKCEGRWDLMLSHYASNNIEYAQMKNKIFRKYGKYVHEYSILMDEEAYIFNRDYLVPSTTQRNFSLYISKIERLDISSKEKELLHLIANNARFKILDLAKALSLDVKTIQNKIKKFEKMKLIQGYTTFFDLNKIGLKFFKIFIYIQEKSEQEYNALFEYCAQLKNVIHIIKTIGSWELELEIEAEDIDYIHKLTKDIMNKFPNIIKKIESVIISDEMKLDFFPQNY